MGAYSPPLLPKPTAAKFTSQGNANRTDPQIKFLYYLLNIYIYIYIYIYLLFLFYLLYLSFKYIYIYIFITFNNNLFSTGQYIQCISNFFFYISVSFNLILIIAVSTSSCNIFDPYAL